MSNNLENRKLYLSEAMTKYEKKFYKGGISIINTHAGSGKTSFIFDDFLNNTYKYYDKIQEGTELNKRLNSVLYVCDTRMLKDSVLKNDKCAILETGGLKEAVGSSNFKRILNNDNGTVKVITYSTLGILLNNKACKHIIMNNFKCIILDEMQNLFNYAIKYNSELDKETGKVNIVESNLLKVINSLKELSENILTIGISATYSDITTYYKRFEPNFKIKYMFTSNELKNIISYNFDPYYTNCIMNYIKTLNYKSIKDYGYKIFINTNTIKQCKKYKDYFTNIGIKSEWLCSPNNKIEVVTGKDDEGNEIIERVPTMTQYQIELRDKLLYDGILPDDLDVLIVNGAYETGWDLRDKSVQIVFIDNGNHNYQIQARNRIRHDIVCLRCFTSNYDAEGNLLEYGQYGELVKVERELGYSRFYYINVIVPKMKQLDSKYIGVKLNKKLKDEIVYKYGIKGLNNKLNWQTVKKDLEAMEYIIKTNKNSTYIYKEGYEIKKDTKRSVKKLNNIFDYLKSIAGNRLNDKYQKILIKNLDVYTTKGLQTKPSKLNEYLRSIECGYVILSKTSNGSRYWIVEETEI